MVKNDEHPIIFNIMSCFTDESWFDKYGEEINAAVDLVSQQEPWPLIIAATDIEVWAPCVFWPDNGAVCEISDILPQFTEDEWP